MSDTQQDVRVRFSAEGMAEVVAAFKQVSSEGKKSAKDTGDAFAALNQQFEQLGRNLVAGLSLVAIADGLKRLLTSTIDSATALQRLSQQTGISTATLQAFQRAAVETGSSAEAANSAVTKFTQQVGKAQIGTKQSANALADLGISMKTLQALTPDQRLLLVAQRLSTIPDQARRARDEMGLFGRGSLEVDQALIKLGQEGIGGFIARMQELGIFLDDKAIAELNGLRLKLEELKSGVQGMGQQFLLGLVPGLSAAADGIAKVTKGGEGFKAIGAAIGFVVVNIAAGFQALGTRIGGIAAQIVTIVGGMADSIGDIAHGKFSKAWDDMASAFNRVHIINEQIKKDVADINAAADNYGKESGPKPAQAAGTAPPPFDPNADAKAKARLALTQAMLDNELKLYEANSKLELDQLKGDYDKGLISLEDYFKRRAAIISAEYDKQIEIAKAKLKAEESLPAAQGANAEVVAIQRATAEEKLRGQIAELNAQKEVALQTEQNNLRTQEIALKQRSEAAEEKLLTLEGKRAEAAKKRLELDIQALQKELQASGASPGEIAAAVSTAQQQGTAKIGYDQAQQQAQANFLQMQNAIKAEQDKVNAGLEYPLTAEQKILDIERQQLPALQANAAAMLKFAQESGNAMDVANAQAFKEKVDAIAVSTNQAAQIMKQLRAGVQNAFADGLNTFLDDALKKSKSLGQAFDDAAKQIMDDLAKMALKIEEDQFLKWLFGGMGGGGSSGSGGGISSGIMGLLGFSAGGLVGGGAGEPVRAATGGYVQGPGSGTSDSIPAMVSNGEFIVHARATAQPGVLPLLQAINARPDIRMPRFAAGGMVGSIGEIGGAIPDRGGRSRATAPSPVVLQVGRDALHATMRDWLEREIADQMAKR